MGLTADQRRWMSTHLRSGLFVAQMAGAVDGVREPFLVEVPDLRFPANSHDGNQQLGDLATLPVVTASLPSVRGPSTSSLPREVQPPSPAGLTDIELRFLCAVLQHPGEPSNAYSKLAGMSARNAVQARKKLVAINFLREHAVATGARGRNAIVLEPLETAIRAVRDAGLLSEGTES